MSDNELPLTPTDQQQPATEAPPEVPFPEPVAEPAVDPVRAAAGRLGGRRVHQLAELGRQYEKEHGLKAGRQRLVQLVQLGRKYEIEHGLRAVKPRRKKGDPWAEFLAALARVVRPAHRPAIEQLARLASEGRQAPERAA